MFTILIGLLAQDGDAVYYAPRFIDNYLKSGQLSEAMIRRATQTLLQNPVVSPAKLVRILEKKPEFLPIFYPMLTECIKFAGNLTETEKKPPAWVNRVLDITIRYIPYIKEAASRGLIPADAAKMDGLEKIAESKAKSTAIEKAKKLIALHVGQ